MGTALILTAPRHLEYETFEDVALKPDEVRVKTLYSGISAGTEMSQYRATSPYMTKRWDEARRLYLPGAGVSWEFPVRNLGYEEVGRVVEVGAAITDIALGTLVFGTWGHRTHAVIPADYARQRHLPHDANPLYGIFSHIGAVALNGVHDGRIRIGETVAVFGLGTVGQIVVQAARQSGARVVAVDLLDARLELAKAHGARLVLNAGRDKVAEYVKDFTHGRGADVCFEASGSTAALNEAIRTAAYSARVVAMGFFQGDATGLILGDEFHHNRINIVASQISGTDPELKYRWDKLRLWQTAIRLQVEGVLDLCPLVTHRAPLNRAIELYEMIDQKPDAVVQAVIEFDG